ncbi:hypothetical protein [uncultured Roseobacter sp.]|uniref:hypothetical protein n=1 Tax=uncultured Roseobacter sp. TaxID=114847 RepID=UPI00260F2B94|nr:hypothetical protein [uncultured Roseobacter sp.]
MQDRYFTDEELVAYLDGEDDLAPVADIAQAAETDAALGARIAALTVDTARIAASFDLLKADERPMPKLPEPALRAPKFQIAGMALAASVALAIGIGIGAYSSGQRTQGWVDYVAAYQALYSNSTLAHIDQAETAKQAELDRVTAAIGKSVGVGTLQTLPEVEYKRAQVLSFNGRALIQLAFLTSTGEPVALCIIRSNVADTPDPALSEMEGLSAARWARDGYDYLLIGGNDAALIDRIATEFSTAQI